MSDDDVIIIGEEDLAVEIVVDEATIQRGVNAYVEHHNDPIVVTPDDLDMDTETSQRFYDKIRSDVRAWAAGKGLNNKYLEYIMLAPDFFILLVRLIADGRVPLKSRSILVGACAYFISPLDAMPEAILGPLGYLDDVVLAALALFVTLKNIDNAIIKEHWSGSGDIVALVRKVVNAGETLLNNDKLWKAFKKQTDYE